MLNVRGLGWQEGGQVSIQIHVNFKLVLKVIAIASVGLTYVCVPATYLQNKSTYKAKGGYLTIFITHIPVFSLFF